MAPLRRGETVALLEYRENPRFISRIPRIRGSFRMLVGSPVRIRTSIDGVRVRSLTVRRPGNSGRAYMPTSGGGQPAESLALHEICKNLDILTCSA